MGLKRVRYKEVGLLVSRYLATEEDSETANLTCELKRARVRGYLTRPELEKICRWKSPRVIRRIKSNTPARIRSITGRALATQSERARLEYLLTLNGVSVPMASAILTLLNPQEYGVIDIRVWQLLHAVGAVSTRSSGLGFTFNHWYQFLMIIRYFAEKLQVSARDVERALFLAHRAHQKGTLYTKRREAGKGQKNRGKRRCGRILI
jgi:hypothetical protein